MVFTRDGEGAVAGGVTPDRAEEAVVLVEEEEVPVASGQLSDKMEVSGGASIEDEPNDPVVFVECEGEESGADEVLAQEHHEGGGALGLGWRFGDAVDAGGPALGREEEQVRVSGRAHSEEDYVRAASYGARGLAGGRGQRSLERCDDGCDLGVGERHRREERTFGRADASAVDRDAGENIHFAMLARGGRAKTRTRARGSPALAERDR